jgi:hypothetical protein
MDIICLSDREFVLSFCTSKIPNRAHWSAGSALVCVRWAGPIHILEAKVCWA